MMRSGKSGNLLIVYSAHSTYTATVKEYLEAFESYTNMNVYYMDGTSRSRSDFDLEFFDAILVTYSVRLSLKNYIHPLFAKRLREYNGPKALTIQDEYDNTEQARKWIEYLGFDLVFTCVPEPYIENIYPSARFPNVKFCNVLTGYVPQRLVGLERVPLRNRTLSVVYRGRPLHPVYGILGYEKLFIGQRFAEECERRGVPCDIAWEEHDRIYGDRWYEFLASGRATLGTESGANVFDFNGDLVKKINQALAAKPDLDFFEIHRQFLADVEARDAMMNQISPKIFEAISLGTALILFEGEYSKILIPDRHYLSLKKDFSNVGDVLAALADDEKMQSMTNLAYDEIVASGKYGYRAFVEMVERELKGRIKSPLHSEAIPVAIFCDPKDSKPIPILPMHKLPTNRPLSPTEWESLRNVSLRKSLKPLTMETLLQLRFLKNYLGFFVRKIGKWVLSICSVLLWQRPNFFESHLKRRFQS